MVQIISSFFYHNKMLPFNSLHFLKGKLEAGVLDCDASPDMPRLSSVCAWPRGKPKTRNPWLEALQNEPWVAPWNNRSVQYKKSLSLLQVCKTYLAQSVLLNQLPLVGAAATIPDLQDTWSTTNDPFRGYKHVPSLPKAKDTISQKSQNLLQVGKPYWPTVRTKNFFLFFSFHQSRCTGLRGKERRQSAHDDANKSWPKRFPMIPWFKP